MCSGGGGGQLPQLFNQSDAQGRVGAIDQNIGNFQDILGTQGSGGLFDQQLGIADQVGIAAGGLGARARDLRGLGRDARRISRGNDPRFAEFRDAQLAQFGEQRDQATSDQNAQLARRGLLGSGAALNQQANLNRQFNLDANSFTSQLGMGQLQRQDAARSQAGGLFGQAGQLGLGQGQLLGQQFDIQSGALQNLLAPTALQAGLLAALLPRTGPDRSQAGGPSVRPDEGV